MSKSHLMGAIKSIHQLFEVESGVLLVQSASESNEVEELTASDKLKHDVLDGLAAQWRDNPGYELRG